MYIVNSTVRFACKLIRKLDAVFSSPFKHRYYGMQCVSVIEWSCFNNDFFLFRFYVHFHWKDTFSSIKLISLGCCSVSICSTTQQLYSIKQHFECKKLYCNWLTPIWLNCELEHNNIHVYTRRKFHDICFVVGCFRPVVLTAANEHDPS